MNEIIELVTQLERARIEILLLKIFLTIIFGILIFLILFAIVYTTIKAFYSKKFSFFIKEKIMNLILKKINIPNLEIEKYLVKGASFGNSLIELLPYSNIKTIKEEDTIFFRYNDIPLLMSELSITKEEGENNIVVFQGIVYQIPRKYVNNDIYKLKEEGEKSLDLVTKLETESFIYIFARQNKDLFELPLFKKIDSRDLQKFYSEIQRKIKFILKYIKIET